MKAEDLSYRCPVCGRSYTPSRESTRVPGEGPLLVTIDEVCIKAGEGWARAYYHGAG